MPTVNERADDRDAAQIWHGVGVALVLAGMVVHVAPQGEPQRERGENSDKADDTRNTARYCQPPPVTTSDSTGRPER